MKVEGLLIRFIIILLLAAVILPLVILLTIKDRALAGQIGDTLGGTSAPLVNISAILAVIATYYYQRRNDQRNARRGLISSNFLFLKDELNNLVDEVTVTRKEVKEVKRYIGKEAIDHIIRTLN